MSCRWKLLLARTPRRKNSSSLEFWAPGHGVNDESPSRCRNGDGVFEKSRAQQNFVGKDMRWTTIARYKSSNTNGWFHAMKTWNIPYDEHLKWKKLRFHVISFLGEFLPQKHLQKSDVMYRFLVHFSRKHSMTIPDAPWEWYNFPTCFRWFMLW